MATIAERTAEPGDSGETKERGKKAAVEGEKYVVELEKNMEADEPRPVMFLFFDAKSAFCLGALQQALNSKAVARMAKSDRRVQRTRVLDEPE